MIKTLLEAEHLPLSTRKMFASGVPASLMVHKDLRIHWQERVVQMMCEIFHGIEASLQQLLREREAELETVDARQVERQAASTKTGTALKAACETVFAHEEKFRENAGSLKKADEDLEWANISLDAVLAKRTKAEEGKARITDVMTHSFTPLKDGCVETQADVKDLLKTVLSMGEDFELESSLLGVVPTALNKTREKRSSFDSLILEQFETGMSEQLVKLDEQIGSLASAQAEAKTIVNNARTLIFSAKETYEISLAALKQVRADQRDAQATHEDAVLNVKSCLPEHDSVLAACKSAQHELIAFQMGALATFHEFEKRVTQKPISDDFINDSNMSGTDGMAVCPDLDVAEKVETQKLEEPIGSDNIGGGSNENIRRLHCKLPTLSDQSIGVMA